ncbi:type III secretion system export apparatus subunit SctV [Noviherbaspirillum sp.]|jgi:type III secretion protein V|uniref:type III secretion system export apparatus subunit SctV n=1 Tax=Noviherbaspirillum sp. TaxID=1926288 RepID=UPI0025E43E05|nr:type III secretion system export apparatus subunit SctV [Noviherbaspirillum sp.]
MERLLQTSQRLVLAASQRADIVFAVILIAVVFMLILPLPTGVVDVLIALNIAASALLLMVAMYLPNPLEFSSFPSVLLITTLFRLALSIATTRLILLQADAGHIIQAFGDFVVGGNLVVGMVVFLILTIVQFIVITKGAERVAEVAARFSLDAMPGKQMSIDGDMRAGMIDKNEARDRRAKVEKESQLYGAMDGAMKFVKGDAIASIIIVAVNLIGGLLIGTMQHDLSAGDAMRVYSVLTVGDGLIAQIPALFIAITAGIIVTRVTNSDNTKSNIGRDISNQILAQPRALLLVATILFGFAFVPGMPSTVFAALAVAAGGVGFVLFRTSKLVMTDDKGKPVPAMARSGDLAPTRPENAEENFSLTVPLMMDVSQELEALFEAELLNTELLSVRKALYFDLGVPFPGIHLRYNKNLPPETYALLVHEIPVTQGRIRPGYVLAREADKTLTDLGIPFEEDKLFLPNIPTRWVAAEYSEQLRTYSAQFMEPLQIPIHHMAVVLKRYAGEFIGVQETRFLISKMEEKFPDLVKELQRLMSPQKIGEILQRLVSEGVSIRNLRGIAEAMIEWGQKEKDSVLLTEHVRTALKRQISYKCASKQSLLPAYMLSPGVEDAVRNAVRQTSAGSYLALDPALSRAIVHNIKRAVGDLSVVSQLPVLLTSMDIRRYVRKIIEQDLFELNVVSYQELSQEVNIQPLARIDLHSTPEPVP